MSAEEDLDTKIKRNAYRIFVVELEKHLQLARGILAENYSPSPTEFIQVGASFHTIKGGAGFFGLSDIAKTAGSLEEMLLTSKDKSKIDIVQVRGLFQQVEELAKGLPAAS